MASTHLTRVIAKHKSFNRGSQLYWYGSLEALKRGSCACNPSYRLHYEWTRNASGTNSNSSLVNLHSTNRQFKPRLTYVDINSTIKTSNGVRYRSSRFEQIKSNMSYSSDDSNEDNELSPKKPGILQRFKDAYKEYGKTLIGVHVVTSVGWYGAFYYAARTGIDVVPMLEYVGASERIIKPFKDSGAGNFAVAYLLYELAKIPRYIVTLGGTQFTVKLLRKWGYMATPAKQDSLKNLVKEGRTQAKTKYDEKKVEIKHKIDDQKDKLKDQFEDRKDKFKDRIEDSKDKFKDRIEDSKDKLKDRIEDSKDKLKDRIEDSKDKFKDRIEDSKDKLKDRLDDSKDKLKDKFSDSKDSLKDKLRKKNKK